MYKVVFFLNSDPLAQFNHIFASSTHYFKYMSMSQIFRPAYHWLASVSVQEDEHKELHAYTILFNYGPYHSLGNDDSPFSVSGKPMTHQN